MTLITNIQSLHDLRRNWQNQTVGFVPTMGALHEGHLSLVRAAKAQCDKVVVSVFVNPTQFGEGEDFDSYPRTIDADTAFLEAENIDILYTPKASEIYPEGFSTAIHLSGISELLCGANRPRHFDGVATIVTKLFNQTHPTHAFFGEKDYQQLCLIRQLVHDLDIDISIIGCPTMREQDGLAMSSRNQYLSVQERVIAPTLYHTLCQTADAITNAGASVETTLAEARATLLGAGFKNIDYLSLHNSSTLTPLTSYAPHIPARLLVAAHLGTTRLIDNIAV